MSKINGNDAATFTMTRYALSHCRIQIIRVRV